VDERPVTAGARRLYHRTGNVNLCIGFAVLEYLAVLHEDVATTSKVTLAEFSVC
jgi:hypothetical protein